MPAPAAASCRDCQLADRRFGQPDPSVGGWLPRCGLATNRTTPTFGRFVTQTWELSNAWLVLSIVEVDMWLSIVAVTLAIAIASCVAAAMMQPRQGREVSGGG